MKNEIILNNEIKELEIDDISDLEIKLDNFSSLDLKILNLLPEKNVSFHASVGEGCKLNIIFADFSKGNVSINSLVDINGENSFCSWSLATLSSNNDKKIYDVSFIHHVGHSESIMDNYGVARDESNLVFKGINYIKKGSKGSKTNQIAKIIVFDKSSSGVASPILKIDENDVNAAHSAVVGQLNENHMFYLMSRGLSKEKAKELITLGYLQPISKHFSPDAQERIEKAIMEAM